MFLTFNLLLRIYFTASKNTGLVEFKISYRLQEKYLGILIDECKT